MRVSDRLRPSNEQLSAQKGAQRLQMLLESSLRYCNFPAVCIVNLTGYVEELALAVARMYSYHFFVHRLLQSSIVRQPEALLFFNS